MTTTTKLQERRVALKSRVNHAGTTVLSDFGRDIRDEPHKYIYKLKYYMKKSNVPAEPLKDWLRERYIESKRKIGARYEVRTFKTANGKRFVDFILIEALTPAEYAKLTLKFGDVTSEKVVRDGKLRRPKLSKTEKKQFDEMRDAFYREVEAKRAAEKAEREANR